MNNNSFENLENNDEKETYFSQENEVENDDWLDEDQDNFFYYHDMDEVEDNYEGFEFDNFD